MFEKAQVCLQESGQGCALVIYQVGLCSPGSLKALHGLAQSLQEAADVVHHVFVTGLCVVVLRAEEPTSSEHPLRMRSFTIAWLVSFLKRSGRCSEAGHLRVHNQEA